jgi:hypothetical protein
MTKYRQAAIFAEELSLMWNVLPVVGSGNFCGVRSMGKKCSSKTMSTSESAGAFEGQALRGRFTEKIMSTMTS